MSAIAPPSAKVRSSSPFDVLFKRLMNEIHAASSPNAIMVGLRNKILKVYDVEMATIFLVDAKKHQLVSWVLLPGEALRKIRTDINRESIIGFVADTQKTLNIPNVYDTEGLKRIHPTLTFDRRWDEKGGCVTRQVLSTPIVYQKNLLGVIQLINRCDGLEFDTDDERRIAELAETLGIALYNHYKTGKKVPLRYEELIKREIISGQEMERAMVIATQQERDVESVLMENFMVEREELGDTLAMVYQTKFMDLTQSTHSVASLVPKGNFDNFERDLIIPVEQQDDTLFLAAKDPVNQPDLTQIKKTYGVLHAKIFLSFGDDIRAVLEKYRPGNEEEGEYEQKPGLNGHDYQEVDERVEIDNSPAIKLVNKILEDAYYAGASDIHIEPYGMTQDSEVRFRIDGHCKNILRVPKHNVTSVIARVKVMADLDISIKRKPQDGKIKFTTTRADNVELRVATIPTAGGNEDVVLRILADSKPLPLEQITPARIYNRITQALVKPHGLFLVVGPTGSGKTTTLHSALNYINTPEKKIWTAEDPVEITQYRLRQVQVKPSIGYTFAAAMRAFLRADPDVIMIGEMRDEETAGMAIEASLTGHLVFSTLHTNSAAETVVRLIDMGLDPFNFSDSLIGILAQRLVRTLCPDCKEGYTPSKKEFDHLVQSYGILFYDHIQTSYSDSLVLYKAKGCDKCNNSGYKGRAGLFELLIASQKIKEMIIDKATSEEIKQEAINNGMTVLLQEGIQLIFDGKTDYNQVMATCSI
ncbi:GspE/PulE family protein [Desulfosediminicola ganghwensis]|uniref:GspE/PulE family protein n=1 Tax=Desulfosediminicola ganghwensis TaxID=2569540 RepID=UPI0010AB7723|nr:GspE/PulE family protein [Desulfosediminicola ganghwensis]